MSKVLTKLSNFLRGLIRVGGRLCGIRRKEGKWNYEQFALAIWVFVLGLPIGSLILGEIFSIFIWAIVVICCLWIVNADDTMLLIAEMNDYGVDNVAP